MAEAEEGQKSGGGGVLRFLLALILLVVAVGVWGSLAQGYYTLEPGEAAVVLRLGKYHRTVTSPGLRLKRPRPFETIEKLAYTELRREKFGYEDVKEAAPGEETATFESAIQTADNNIVNLSYVVQYRVRDASSFVYGMADPRSTLRDVAQSAVREVVAKRRVQEVLTKNRAAIELEAKAVLQRVVDGYFGDADRAPFQIDRVQLQVVQAPSEVQAAFSDVVAAQQDEDRALSEARGDAREIEERANAQGIEVREAALAYRDAKILEAKGEADRFEALLTEYQRAPEVTRQRLYLETMEQILPNVDKVIVEPETVNLMPYFPLEGRRGPRAGAAEAADGGGAR